jgi:hypothetical protein
MTKLTLRVFAVLGLLAASALSAFSESDYVLRVHVPFAFVVGRATLPAGDYTIQQDGVSGVVTLQNRTAKSSAAVISLNGEMSLRGKEPQLVFSRINGQTVLTRIELTNAATRLMPQGLRTSALH